MIQEAESRDRSQGPELPTKGRFLGNRRTEVLGMVAHANNPSTWMRKQMDSKSEVSLSPQNKTVKKKKKFQVSKLFPECGLAEIWGTKDTDKNKYLTPGLKQPVERICELCRTLH